MSRIKSGVFQAGFSVVLLASAGCGVSDPIATGDGEASPGQEQAALAASGQSAAVVQRANPPVAQFKSPGSNFNSIDTVQQYAAKCEDATGIRIPSFSCENGYEVPEGTVSPLLVSNSVGGVTFGLVTPTTPGFVQTVTARGSDIWGTADQFFFGSIPLDVVAPRTTPLVTGPGTLEAQITALSNTNEYTKAGVMFRWTTNAGSINIMMALSPGHGAIFSRRLTPNGNTDTTEAPAAIGSWVRLVRTISGVNSVFTGFVSPDRITWTPVGPAVTVANFPTSPLAGIALTSHNTGATATATFDRVRWSGVFETLHNNRCDAPNQLNHECDPGSRFQVLAQTGDAAAVAHCRKRGFGPGRYSDIAVIQYNKVTGGICFYQAQDRNSDGSGVGDGQGLDGTNIPAPLSSNVGTNFRWYDPGEANQFIGCPQCHDSGAFIRSPYLVQTGLLPNREDKFDNGFDKPVRWVGSDFANERSWSIYTANDPSDTYKDAQGNSFPNINCTGCHRLSVNNHLYGEGTAASIANLATADNSDIPILRSKNPHSEISPIWMRKGQSTYFAGAEATATKYSDCATGFWYANGQFLDPGFSSGNSSVPGCTFAATPEGQPWVPPDFDYVPVGVMNGQDIRSGTQHTVTVKGKDIYDNTDEFFYTLAYAGSASGDGIATVKVNSLTTNVNAYAKAGLMFRDSLLPTANHVMVDVTATQGAQFQYRLTNGGTTTASTPLAGKAAPSWLRLHKSGSNVSGWVSSDYITWTQVAAPVSVPNLSSTASMGLAVTSHDQNVPVTAVMDRFSWVPLVDGLADTNIGLLTGTNTQVRGNRQIVVGGVDIFGTTDQFFFSFKQVSGDNIIIMKVNSLANSNPYAKAGLMFRSSINPDAVHAMMDITATMGAQFQYRLSNGATAVSNTPNTAFSSPVWLKLERVGNTFNGYASKDKGGWILVGTMSVPNMPTDALVGVAVTGHGATTTANLSNVLINPPSF